MITENTVSSDEVIINAPAKLVWDILVDFENYSTWNEFCPQIKGKPEVGSPVEMLIDLGAGPQVQVEHVTKVEPIHTIVWSMENKPGDPIHADRAQYIKAIDDSSCSYVSIDNFSGEMVPQMMQAMAGPVEQGFNLCARNLKDYAESLHQKT